MADSLHISLSGLFCMIFSLAVHSQDCTLASYLENGVSNSPVLKDLSIQIQSNQYDSLIARATYLPQVNFNGLLMYAPVINGWGYSEAITNGQNLVGTVNVNQHFLNRKTREAEYNKYALESGNLDNTLKISRSELKKAITAQYLAACTALEERKFQQEMLKTLDGEARIVKSGTEKGIYRKTDYLSLQIEILSLEQNIRDLDLQYRKEYWNLGLICGMDDTTFCDLQLPEIRDTVAQPAATSIFLRGFLLDSLILRNEQLLIDQRYKPAIGWFADGGVVNNKPRYLYQNFGVSAGLSVTLPVFDGNQRKINYNKIRMREETRKNYQENFLFRQQAQLNQLKAELEQMRISTEQNEKQVALVRELVAADSILLNNGSLPINEYILAIKNLVEARHAGLVYKIRTQYILNEINFRKQ